MVHNFSLTLVQEIGMAVDFFLNEDILSPSVKAVIITFYSILVTIAGEFRLMANTIKNFHISYSYNRFVRLFVGL